MNSGRIVVPGYAHHVCERGVRKTPLFYEDSDYLVYIRNLRNGCQEHGLEITAYALMPNHVHLIAIPEKETSISRTLHHTHSVYSNYFNAKYGFVGHAWDRRARSCVMDDLHMWNAVRYVERNPVRALLVERAEDYSWSSAAAHCGLRDDILLADHFPPPGIVPNWSEWLRIDHTEQEKKAIRRHLSTGRPWCLPEMLQVLQTLTGRSLQPLKRGRPRKAVTPSSLLPFKK